jgi:hypothetical protein
MDMNDRSLVMVMTQGIGGASDQRGKVHAFDRFEARTHNRSGLHSRRFCCLKNRENCCPNAVGISATSTSNVTASRQKEQISVTNKARVSVVGSAAASFDVGQRFGGDSHEKRYRSSSA